MQWQFSEEMLLWGMFLENFWQFVKLTSGFEVSFSSECFTLVIASLALSLTLRKPSLEDSPAQYLSSAIFKQCDKSRFHERQFHLRPIKCLQFFQ